MKKFRFLLKIIACIIMQALLLTQVEFSLAAAYQNDEFNQNRELAYKFRYNIGSLSADLLSAQSFITGLISALCLRTNSVFRINSRSMSGKGYCNVNKEIYKVFVNNQQEILIKNRFLAYLVNNVFALNKLAETETEDATGPPIKEKSDLAREVTVTELLG